MRRALAALALCAASTAYADRPVDLVVVRPHTAAPAAVTSNVIYLNNCEPSGCTVRYGNDNATTNTSSLGQGPLTAFRYDDATWQQVVQCVNDVFSPFDVQIVTTKPTASTYMEIMIAGSPQDIGEPANVGGVAEFPCDNYVPNALVFDFANVWSGDVEGICATAAQEIAHTWALDHSTDPMDPMTYFNTYSGRKYYDNKEQQCGSDCVNGRGPFGQACTGQNHSCTCTGSQDQNSYATILALFGAGTPTPPTVKITAPMDQSLVAPGFTVAATVTSMYGVAKADLVLDGTQAGEVTTSPFLFSAPSTLGPGMHTVSVVGYDVHGVTAMDQVMVASQISCTKDSDCPFTSDVCVSGTCVVGPNGPGGLGMTCTSDTGCSSGQCASDGTASHCVDPCSGAGQCPSGYGCETTGSGSAGFCWPGYDDGTSGGGGCNTGGGGAPVLLLGLGAMLVASRRRAR